MATKIDFRAFGYVPKALETADIPELIAELEAENVFMTTSKTGVKRFNLEYVQDDAPMRFSIRLAESVKLTETDEEAQVIELVKNYVVYTGTTDKDNNPLPDGRRWFSFGKPQDQVESNTKKISTKNLLAAIRKESTAVGAGA